MPLPTTKEQTIADLRTDLERTRSEAEGYKYKGALGLYATAFVATVLSG